jgi:hypothetical protein
MVPYRIHDEPDPGVAARLAVSPLWPVLALLFAGAWLAWPWLALNAFALGARSRARQLFVAVLALGATVALTRLGLATSLSPEVLAVGVLAAELPLAWLVYREQRDAARVFAQGGVTLASGFWPLVLGALVRVPLVQHLDSVWARALS